MTANFYKFTANYRVVLLGDSMTRIVFVPYSQLPLDNRRVKIFNGTNSPSHVQKLTCSNFRSMKDFEVYYGSIKMQVTL